MECQVKNNLKCHYWHNNNTMLWVSITQKMMLSYHQVPKCKALRESMAPIRGDKVMAIETEFHSNQHSVWKAIGHQFELLTSSHWRLERKFNVQAIRQAKSMCAIQWKFIVLWTDQGQLVWKISYVRHWNYAISHQVIAFPMNCQIDKSIWMRWMKRNEVHNCDNDSDIHCFVRPCGLIRQRRESRSRSRD